jgi:uncharacterized protein YjbI with pentapeptide repeats
MAKAVAAAGVIVDKKLLALEEQAEDLGEARKALESATNIGRGLWFTFLSLVAYLVIAVGSVTHKDLFLETPIRLPLLNVELPLVAFFWVAPLMFLVVHGYLLMHLRFMGDNARYYFGLVDKTGLDVASKGALYLQLPNFIVLQMIIARRAGERSIMGFLIHFVVVLTLVIGPVLVLVLMQLQFLPYHSIPVTTVQRLTIIADMGIVLYFWPEIEGGHPKQRLQLFRYSVWTLMLSIILFSGFVATFPGEKNYDIASIRDSGLATYLFRGPYNEITGKRASIFSDTLALSDTDFVDLDDKDYESATYSVSVRGRNLIKANLARTDLRKADFSGANLTEANFKGARLQDAQFGCPNSQLIAGVKTKTSCAVMKNATLDEAHLEGAFMQKADISGASLQKVSLQQVKLDFANLRGAQITNSVFEKASMISSDLTGAGLARVDLRGANLNGANFAGTVVTETLMQGANLTSAKMSTAAFIEVNVWGVSDSNVDWHTTVVKNLRSVEKDDAFTSVGKGAAIAPAIQAGACGEANSITGLREKSVAKPEDMIRKISCEGIRNRSEELTDSDPALWRPRVDKLIALVCEDKENGRAVFKRIVQMPDSGKDVMIQFGPFRNMTSKILLDATKCANSALLDEESNGALEMWAAEGTPVAEILRARKAAAAKPVLAAAP